MSADAESNDPYIGRTLDKRYRVDRLIGRGGMGAVYEAHHIGLDRKVAVKFVLGADADAKARFQREARAASKVDHDHVVHIYDVGVDETGADFIAMEFVEGVDLKEALAAGPFDVVRTVHVAKQLVAGLGAVHDAGIVHRDIKPANIMLTEHDDHRDFVKIMDFGISKAIVRPGAPITLAGRVVGTPAYMAPEQLLGDDADPRSDLYAAALVIYEMISGTPPFRADNTDLLVEQRLSAHPTRLDELHPAVPAALARVIDRALDKVPAQRYADADALLAALDIPLDKGRLDSRTVAVRPAPSEQPTAQLTPATAVERPGQLTPATAVERRPGQVTPATAVERRPAPAPIVTSSGAAPGRAKWPLVLAVLLVLGVPLGVFFAMRGGTKTTPAVPPPAPIVVATDAAIVSESAKLLAAAEQADREGRSAEALAAYRTYLEAEPNAADATRIVERIAALAPPPTPIAEPMKKSVVKIAKTCTCFAGRVSLCKERTAAACRCETGGAPLCVNKPERGACAETSNMPLTKQAQTCEGWLSWASHFPIRGSVRCRFCPAETGTFRGQPGDTCEGIHPTGGGTTVGFLRDCH